MAKPLMVLAVAVVAGCSEYSFDGPDVPVWGEANPPPIPGDEQTDRIRQLIVPTVDILWVVDNSCSMQDERNALALNFPLFMEYFVDSGSDYHIGVVSTDMGPLGPHAGKLQEENGVRWITPDTPNAVQVFTQMAAEINGSLTSGSEQGRTAAYTALETLGDGWNAGFLRDDPEAYLHITVVSDEDDSSSRVPIGHRGFVNWMNNLRPFTHRTSWNSIVTVVPQNNEETRGNEYIDLTDDLGGRVWDLHSGQWDTILDDLGGLQSPKPTNEFFLSQRPVPDTLDVKVLAEGITFVFVQPDDYVWNQERNSIQFTQWIPPEGAEIEVTYTLAGT